MHADAPHAAARREFQANDGPAFLARLHRRARIAAELLHRGFHELGPVANGRGAHGLVSGALGIRECAREQQRRKKQPHGIDSARCYAEAMRKLLFLILFSVTAVNAQTYPSKPVKLVVGFTPGGGVDINARLLAPKLAEYLGQPFLVDNRPGAGTNIANELVAKAPADGYTLLVNTAALAINMSLYPKLPFDALRDFIPVSVFSE